MYFYHVKVTVYVPNIKPLILQYFFKQISITTSILVVKYCDWYTKYIIIIKDETLKN